MPKLPNGPFSIRANDLETMIAEGRVEEALQKLAGELETGKADAAVQRLAANWILALGIRHGDAKALRGGKDRLKEDWLAIAEHLHALQEGQGMPSADALEQTAAHFGCSTRHVEKCRADYNEGRRLISEEESTAQS